MNEGSRTGLRFGVMCSSTTLPAWQARCLEALLAVPGVEPALLIVDDRPAPSRRAADRVARLARAENGLWKAFNDGWVARRAASVQRVDLSGVLDGVPRVHCRVTMRGRYSEIFSDADVETIRGHDLDFILRFAFGIIRGDILDAARFGVWSFHHDDEQRVRGGPPCFWEIYDGEPVTGVMLQRLTDRLDAGIVLHKGHVKTVATSYARNTDASHFAGATFPAKICRDILAGCTDALTVEPVHSDAPIRRNPTNREMFVFLRRVASNYVRAQLRSSFTHDVWNVGVVDAPISRFLDPAFDPEPAWLPSPPSQYRYLADPFGNAAGDTLLVEALEEASQLGVLRAVDARTGVVREPAPVFPVSVHLSYPYLLESRGETYCVPELARGRDLHLFRARRFPDAWEDAGVLIPDVAAVDPTIFEHDGRWWCFFTAKDVDVNAALHVWHAPALLGPWEPHSSNPVKTDVRSARPAGTPFLHEGRLYRPAQDCSLTYGGAIVLNEVAVLTPHRFRERVVRVVSAPKTSRYPAGRHTLSRLGEQTVIDGKRRAFTSRGARGAVLAKAKRRVQRPSERS